MQSASILQQKIKEAFLKAGFLAEPSALYEPIDYTLTQSGKRLRPLLALMSCDLFGGDPDLAMYPAMGLEIFHNFTLLHDDIMDRAPVRRGRATVHRKWNVNTAILSGDTMFVIAYEYITKTESSKLSPVLELFNTTAREVCEGQQYDMNFESEKEVSIPDYLKMIRLKTAVLLACSLKLGAILAGAEKEAIDQIYDFGENLGLAFQLQDDYLDAFGDFKKFGKEIGNDILTNKKTFLYLKAFELAREDTLIKLTRCFSDQELPPSEKIGKITEIYRELKIDEITREEILLHFGKGLGFLDAIKVENGRKAGLKALALEMIGREK